MKFLLPTLLINLLSASFLLAQCPSDYVYLKNQAQIDSFAITYPNCKSLQQYVLVQPDSPETDDITNLDAFAGLDSLLDLSVRKCNFLTEVKINEFANIGNVSVSRCSLIEKVQVINNLANDGWLYLNELPSFDTTRVYNIDSLAVLTVDEIPVSSLGFLGNIKDVTIRVNLLENPLLNDISQMEDFTTIFFRIRDNPNLSICAIDPVCRAMDEDIHNVEINNNGEDCRDVFDIYYSCFPAPDTCVFTSLTLRSQMDLDQLSLLPDQCVDSIKSIFINGNLDVPDPVTDLTNLLRFRNLDKLSINSNAHLSSLIGLDSLVSIGELYLQNNPLIKSFEGLRSLKNTGLINVGYMDSLTSISNTEMTLQQCNKLTISHSPVKDFSSFASVDSFASISIINTHIKDLSWASDIRMVNFVNMTQNDSLLSFSFDEDGPLIGDLIIEDNISLSEITGVSFQDSVNRIEIQNNPIHIISNISGPKEVSGYIVIQNTNISELPPWGGVDEAAQINIVENNLLEGIEFLKGFTKINRLVITFNELLTQIGSTAIDIEYIDYLGIQNNPLLTDISVLDYDFDIDRIYIRNNPSLATCDALAICKEYKSIYPDINLDGNGDKCNLTDLNFECEFGNNAYGDVRVKSQADIDSVEHFFPLMDSVFGNLVIDFSLNPDGADFSFFDNIQFVRDRLEIRNPKTDGVFELFEGAKVGGLLLAVLEISSLDILDYKEELSILRLYEVDGITDFKGLENVEEIREFNIVYTSIKSLDGLENFKEGYEFQIVDCPELEDIGALSNFEKVRDFRLAVLPQVTGLEVFDSLQVYFDLQLNAIPLMTKVPSFDVGKQLSIFYLLRNEGITEIAFDSLERVSMYFFISENPNLKNISFENLAEVRSFSISNNARLEQISLPSLLEAKSSLAIRFNDAIEDLSGINPEALTPELSIHDNKSLQVCNSELVCNNESAGSVLRIENNPGCQSLEEVLSQCTVAIEDINENPVKLYPNPTSGTINILGQVDLNTLQLFNSYGQLMKISRENSTVIISNYNPGLYFLKYKSGANWYVAKIIRI